MEQKAHVSKADRRTTVLFRDAFPVFPTYFGPASHRIRQQRLKFNVLVGLRGQCEKAANATGTHTAVSSAGVVDGNPLIAQIKQGTHAS